MQIIDKSELTFGRNGLSAKVISSLAMSVLGLNKINGVYARAAQHEGSYVSNALRELGIVYSVEQRDITNIPAEGGVIIVANHPTGAADGLILIDLISQKRPDVKFMGNFLLKKIDALADYFISVDPFENPNVGRNTAGIKAAMSHVASGGVLVIFPAGEVATWQRGFSSLRDKPWSRSVLRFIRKCNVPVVPVCIEARNSIMFHLAGKVHPVLRTVLLPHELLNKRGEKIKINIGSPISVKRVEELTDISAYGDFLRANVVYLHRTPRRKRKIVPRLRKKKVVVADDVISPTCLTGLCEELDRLRPDHMMFEYGSYEVFFAHPREMPNMLNEIGRMREITFREIGEGSMKSIDTDHYDDYYRQLFIWDSAAKALVGAYRMGMGDEIIDQYGLKGFYTNSLFRMSKEMEPIMRNTIELGRSFVTKAYQRKAISLLLLWKGIIYVLLKNEQYRNLFGPVTISGEFQTISKTIIVRYLQKHHVNKKIASYIHAKTGLDGVNSRIDDSLMERMQSIDQINKIVCDIEYDELTIPVLLKKYLQLNCHVLAFNVDHEFCDALDTLILVDLKQVPESIIAMLTKEITDIDVFARFQKYH